MFEMPRLSVLSLLVLDRDWREIGEGGCADDWFPAAVTKRCVIGKDRDWLLVLGSQMLLCHSLFD